MKLPELPLGSRIRQQVLTRFGGLRHTAGAEDGDIYDMRNLWSGDFPRLSVRPGRKTLGTVTKPNGLFRANGSRFIADGTTLYVDGVSAGTLADSPKVFAALGSRVLIWPDKKVWTAAGGLESLEASYTASGLVFADGTYAGETAKKNSVTTPGEAFPFRAGDAVNIPACTPTGGKALTLVVREVSADGKTLRFYEDSFAATGTVSAALTLSRTVPDLDWICVNENRVWGCRGDTIRASKLGDPFNWNVFDGLSTDAWSWESGTEGDFTGCVSFLGYPCFFKERHIFKVYGSRPSNFEPQSAPDFGVMAGCGRSLAIAGENLYYLSRVGPVVYAGGIPRPLGEPLGAKLSAGAGGSDGLKYYLSAQSGGDWLLYVYDAARQLWHVEDATRGAFFAPGSPGSVECLTAGGSLWTTDTEAAGTAEGQVSWWAEFGDFTRNSPNKKGLSKLLLRLEPGAGSTVSLLIRYDSAGDWETVAALTAASKGSRYLAVVPRRCDHFRLKLTGTGGCVLHSLTTEAYVGSPN